MTTYPTTREGTSDLWEALYTQRAIRYWEEREVPDELIWRVIEAATRAPSGLNLQPWRFVVVTDPAQRAKITNASREQALAQGNLEERLERVRASDDRSHRLMMTGATTLFQTMESAPVFIIPCVIGITSPTTDPDSLLAGSSIYGAIQNLQLAARALGLGTVLTTRQAGMDAMLRRELKIPDEARMAALIPMGYPAANFGPTRRRPVEEVTAWNTWDTVRTRPQA